MSTMAKVVVYCQTVEEQELEKLKALNSASSIGGHPTALSVAQEVLRIVESGEPAHKVSHKVYRSAQTGEYVDKAYAQAHPDVTVEES